MQQEVIRTGARDSIVVAGRGTGKGVLHAQTNLRNFQLMPRSTTAFVAPNGKRALTNTLPSMLMHWEAWGYRRDIHWCIGHPPPKALNWPKPLITPACWDNIISFYTGAIGQIISQDRKGTSNSKSFDFLDIDEAKFIDFEQLKDETFQANRGQTREFGDLPFHHGMLITSDMPVTKKGSWFLHYEKDSDPQLIALIQGLVLQRYKLQQQLLLTTGPTPALKHSIAELDHQLTELRRQAVFYKTYSSLTNMAVLGGRLCATNETRSPAPRLPNLHPLHPRGNHARRFLLVHAPRPQICCHGLLLPRLPRLRPPATRRGGLPHGLRPTNSHPPAHRLRFQFQYQLDGRWPTRRRRTPPQCGEILLREIRAKTPRTRW